MVALGASFLEKRPRAECQALHSCAAFVPSNFEVPKEEADKLYRFADPDSGSAAKRTHLHMYLLRFSLHIAYIKYMNILIVACVSWAFFER